MLEINKQNFPKKDTFIYAPNGAFLIFTPTFFRYFDGFDKGTFLYCEEFLLAEMLYHNNLLCLYTPTIEVFHKRGQTTKKINKSAKKKLQFVLKHTYESYVYFIKKF